jgi:glyoxylase-like metal-dependent hydrolase (beta-lactamase superfamily II)
MAVHETITRYETSSGVRIYRIPMQVFPHLTAYAYLVIAGDYTALIDSGSGQGLSNDHLRDGFAAVATEWGEAISWAGLDRIIISHAHIDHHGGLNMLRELTDAPIAVHELDWRVLTHHEERLALARFRLNIFLQRSGVDEPTRERLLRMYCAGKDMYHSLDVRDVMREGDLLDGQFQIYHAPGHCPGQVCLQLEDVLFSADHILPNFSIFLAPEGLNAYTGVGHYLEALDKIRRLPGINLVLGAHDEPIDDLEGAAAQISAGQYQRIERVYEACTQAHSIAELTRAIYPDIGGYDELLALQKIGAYIEYLDQRGRLEIDNLEAVAHDDLAIPRYRAI